MNHYIIDGNNLIGKITNLSKLQKKDKQSARERLVFMLDRYFAKFKYSVSLHLDGYPGERLSSTKMKIFYSEKLTADEKIKNQINSTAARKNITLVTSDMNLTDYARVCGCKVVSSESFVSMIEKLNQDDDEEKRIMQLNNKTEFLKLFGVDESDDS